MTYIQFKSALIAMLLAIATTGSTYAMFEVKFDMSDITINGQSIKQGSKPLVDIGLSCIGGYLASKYLTNENQSFSRKVDTTIMGATVGWLTSDFLYKNTSTKKVITKTATGIGIITGLELLAILAPPR